MTEVARNQFKVYQNCQGARFQELMVKIELIQEFSYMSLFSKIRVASPTAQSVLYKIF